MSWMNNVFSSNVQQVGYDEATGEMLVQWKNGRTSAYKGVPEELAQQVSQAASVGQMLNAEIKPFYEHRYV